MSRIMRWVAIPAVLVILTVSTAQAWPAVPVRPALAAPEAESVLDAAWNWLTSLVRRSEPNPPGSNRSTGQEKTTCGADPWGNPLCSS